MCIRDRNRDEYYQSEEYFKIPNVSIDYMTVLDRLTIDDVIINDQPEHEAAVNKILSIWEQDGYKFTGNTSVLLDDIVLDYCDPGKPQFRLFLLPCSKGDTSNKWKHIIYVTNHIGSDGTSSVNMLEDLSNELGKLTEDVEPMRTIFDYDQDHTALAKLPDPIEQKIDYQPSKWTLAKLVFSILGREYVSKLWEHPRTTRIDNSPAEHWAHLLKVTPLNMAKMKTRVKEKLHGQATLTPFLQACWFVSCYQAGIFENRKWNEYFANMSIPMNCRQLLPEDKELRDRFRYGSNIGGTNFNYPISSFNVSNEKDFWDLTNHYQEWFVKSKEQNLALKTFGMFFMDSVASSQNLDKLLVDHSLNKLRTFTLFSNIGYFSQSTQEKNPYQLQDLVFSQTANEMPFIFSLSCVSTDIKGMSFMLTCSKDSITKPQWELVCQNFEENLYIF